MALDAEGGSINVVSLPRDTLLNVSWSVKKLNNAYHHGGITRTVEEVSNLLGIPVDYYVTVDLEAFVAWWMPSAGWTSRSRWIWTTTTPTRTSTSTLTRGWRHLTGEEALQVVRWRQNNDGTGYATADIGRIGTQQAFLTAVAQQTFSSPTGQDPRHGPDLPEYVDTELTVPNLCGSASRP